MPPTVPPRTPDLADYLAAGGDLESLLDGAVPMARLADRRAEDLTEARTALAAAMRALGAAQTTRDERDAAARGLLAHVEALAWLAVLAPEEWAVAIAALASAGGFVEAAKRIERAVKTATVPRLLEIRDEERRDAPPATAAQGADLAAALGPLAASAALPCALRVPPMYAVGAGGVWAIKVGKDGAEERTRIATRPMFVRRIAIDAEDGSHQGELCWHDGTRWHAHLLPRSDLAVARDLAQRSSLGVPVSSASASDVVRYLEAFLAANEATLPRQTTTTTLGWRTADGGADTRHAPAGYLWGSTWIGPGGPVLSGAPVAVSLHDPAMAQFTAGYQTAGTWEGWCEAITALRRHPLVMLALYAAVVPPLLRLLPGAANFVVDLGGGTSQGKTTSLRAASSVWGVPSAEAGGLIRTWGASQTYIERYAHVSRDLPVFLDDTKRAQRPETVANVLYMIAQGQGAGRGTIAGVQATSTWRTVALSTGESSAITLSPQGGGAVRCLPLWGAPLGEQSAAAAELAEATEIRLLAHHGHLGPRLVAWLQAPGRAEWLRERYAAGRAEWAERAGDNAPARRALGYIGALYVAEACCRDLGVPSPAENVLWTAWAAVVSASQAADRAATALRDVYEWCASNQHSFIGRHVVQLDGTANANQDARAPTRGWLGRWPTGDWEWIAIVPTQLREYLAGHGYDAEAVVRTWGDRGWLRVDTGRQLLSVRLGTGRFAPKARCVAIDRKALVGVGVLHEGETSDGGADVQARLTEDRRRYPGEE